jgi:aminopeptidase N
VLARPGMLVTEPGPGRSALLEVVSYHLELDLTRGTGQFGSAVEVRFRSQQPGAATFADLRAARIQQATLNGTPLDVAAGQASGRIELPGLADDNVLCVKAECDYAPAGAGLHYVAGAGDGLGYACSRASSGGAARMYCCFDEPDLRAPFTVAVTVPAGWSCLANGPEVARPRPGEPGTWRFAPTDPIPPWLSAVCAGPWVGEAFGCERPGASPLPIAVHTLPVPAAEPRTARVAEFLAGPLRFYERSLGVPYPYGRCDVVFVPELPDLAYSVPGLIVAHDQVLSEDPPGDGGLYLATVLAHELAHAWLGSLVTMRRAEDRWLDEALTTYLSRAALAAARPGFSPWDEAVSATLPDHGYAAGAAVIRQLEERIGPAAVAGGLGLMARRHAHGSVTAGELARCWSEASGQDLAGWAARALRPGGE